MPALWPQILAALLAFERYVTNKKANTALWFAAGVAVPFAVVAWRH